MTDRQKQTERLGAKLDPEVRAWIKNVIVPILVRRSIAEITTSNRVADQVRPVPHSQSKSVPSAEGIL